MQGVSGGGEERRAAERPRGCIWPAEGGTTGARAAWRLEACRCSGEVVERRERFAGRGSSPENTCFPLCLFGLLRSMGSLRSLLALPFLSVPIEGSGSAPMPAARRSWWRAALPLGATGAREDVGVRQWDWSRAGGPMPDCRALPVSATSVARRPSAPPPVLGQAAFRRPFTGSCLWGTGPVPRSRGCLRVDCRCSACGVPAAYPPGQGHHGPCPDRSRARYSAGV